MIVPQITISQDLLTLLGQRLYNAYHSTIVTREVLQNSIDAGSTHIVIDVMRADDRYIEVTCTDNGCGMNQETLLDVFLGIGKTGKALGESVGGFGIAKVALFSGQAWKVQTKVAGDNIARVVTCENNALVYSEEPRPTRESGTSVYVKTRDYYIDLESVKRMLTIERKVKLVLTVFGEIQSLPRLKPRNIDESSYRGTSFTVKYAPTHDDLQNHVLYRIRGLPQYAGYISGLDNGCLIVDFDSLSYRPRDDSYPFSLSRESVTSSVSEFVSAIAKRFIVDKISATAEGGEKFILRRIGNYVHQVKRGDDIPDNPYLLKLWTALVKLAVHDTECLTGYTTDHESDAKRGHYNDIPLYLINLEHVNFHHSPGGLVLDLLHTGIHEAAHATVSLHDEEFASIEGSIASAYADAFYEALSKLTKIARKAKDYYKNPRK